MRRVVGRFRRHIQRSLPHIVDDTDDRPGRLGIERRVTGVELDGQRIPAREITGDERPIDDRDAGERLPVVTRPSVSVVRSE
jgi:hypothetical protein